MKLPESAEQYVNRRIREVGPSRNSITLANGKPIRSMQRAWKLHRFIERRLGRCHASKLNFWISVIERVEREYPPSPSCRAWEKFMDALENYAVR